MVQLMSSEHANITVTEQKNGCLLEAVFGLRIRWQSRVLNTGFTVHIGTEAKNLAFYCPTEL